MSIKKSQVVILSGGKMYGPFPDQTVATTWVESRDSKGSTEMYSFWDTEEGTGTQAHECGSLLPRIEDLESEKQSRRA